MKPGEMMRLLKGLLDDYKVGRATELTIDEGRAIETLLNQITQLRTTLARFLDWAPRCAQLLDGWHCDIAWSEYDSSVRAELSEIQKAANAAGGEHGTCQSD